MATYWVMSGSPRVHGTIYIESEKAVLEEFGTAEFMHAGMNVSNWLQSLCRLTRVPYLVPPETSSFTKHLSDSERMWMSILPTSVTDLGAERDCGEKRVGELVWANQTTWARLEPRLGPLVRSWPTDARRMKNVKWLLKFEGPELVIAGTNLGLTLDCDSLLSLTEGALVHNKLISQALTRAVRVALRNFKNVCRWPGAWEPWNPDFPAALKGWPITFVLPFCNPNDRKAIESMIEKWQLTLLGHLSLFKQETLERIRTVKDAPQLVKLAHAVAKA